MSNLDIEEQRALLLGAWLSKHNSQEFEEPSHMHHFCYEFEDGSEWYILTDNELEEMKQEMISDMIQDIVDIEEQYKEYFDYDRFAQDYLDSIDDSFVASYDGYVHEHEIFGNTYYIFRVG